VRVAAEQRITGGCIWGMMGIQRFFPTLAITLSILFGNGNHVLSFDGGGSHQKQQPTLCQELIIPSGYPCSEYTVPTIFLF